MTVARADTWYKGTGVQQKVAVEEKIDKLETKKINTFIKCLSDDDILTAYRWLCLRNGHGRKQVYLENQSRPKKICCDGDAKENKNDKYKLFIL